MGTTWDPVGNSPVAVSIVVIGLSRPSGDEEGGTSQARRDALTRDSPVRESDVVARDHRESGAIRQNVVRAHG
ncbi:MAG: hypothetical protein ACYCXY_10045, partial [Acidimicrobiales bacterium]